MKNFKTLCLLSLFFIFSSANLSNGQTYQAEKTGKYFQTWLLCGPFPNPSTAEGQDHTKGLPGFYSDYLKEYGGEANPKIKAGDVVKYEGGEAKWMKYQSENQIIDFSQALGPKDHALAYGYCLVKANQPGYYLLMLGSDDGVRVWVNGEELWDNPVGRGLKPDQDIIPVRLNRGLNTLLLKVENGAGDWGFSVRLMPYSQEPFTSVRFFEARRAKDKKTYLFSVYNSSYTKSVFKRVNFNLRPAEKKDTVIWSADWPFGDKIELPGNDEEYRDYRLSEERVYANGTKGMTTIPLSIGMIENKTLFENGRTNYRIVISRDASESESWAAQELRTWLREMSGADFPIYDDSQPLSKNEIILGINRHTEEILKNETPHPSAMDESFTIRSVGPQILIYGGKTRGTMYGVMDFLETYFGCRWYTPAVSKIPKKDRYSFIRMEKSDGPSLRVRNDFYFEAFDPLWAARNRVNGAMQARKQPGGVEAYWSVHTFYRLVLPEEFFDEHPEYFSLINGKRTKDNAQLCLSNPDVLRILVERLKQVMRENPDYLIYCVSQNDCGGACQCDACQAIAKREGSESGPVLSFVNKVAEAAQKEFPDKYIGTLAYQYTRKPPKTIRPRKNVVIRLCSIECCFAHSFYDCPLNQSFLKDLRDWASIAPNLYIWDYVVNFRHYLLPHPNFYALQPNLKAFRENKAIGVMEQAAYQNRGTEFAELRAYVISKLLWNPDYDVEAVIDDFMSGYFGRSGQYIRQYFDLLHKLITPETHLFIFDPVDKPLFTEDFIYEADRIFDKAERVADDESIRRRVEVARLPVMYLKLNRDIFKAYNDGTYERFKEITERENITRHTEWTDISPFFKELKKKLEIEK